MEKARLHFFEKASKMNKKHEWSCQQDLRHIQPLSIIP